jgi:hypothetical protein
MTLKSRTGGDKSLGVDRTREDGGPIEPKDLRPETLAKWRFLISKIEPSILRAVDEIQLRILAELIVQVDRLAEQIATDPTDHRIRRLQLATAQHISRLSALFGLSPADRMRMKLEPPEDPDELTLEKFNEMFGS